MISGVFFACKQIAHRKTDRVKKFLNLYYKTLALYKKNIVCCNQNGDI